MVGDCVVDGQGEGEYSWLLSPSFVCVTGD